MLISFGGSGVRPARRSITASAQTLACAFAAKADFGIAPAMAASPTTWMPATSRDSKVMGSIGHQPERSATPAALAMGAARWGGMMQATSALYVSKSVATVIAFTSTEETCPPAASGT